jgi:hypothetical protein
MYTVEVYKVDGRVKKTRDNPNGERLVFKKDYDTTDRVSLEHVVRTSLRPKERYEIHETYVTKINMMSGKEFTERYDTPYYCSPSSESYWSM